MVVMLIIVLLLFEGAELILLISFILLLLLMLLLLSLLNTSFLLQCSSSLPFSSSLCTEAIFSLISFFSKTSLLLDVFITKLSGCGGFTGNRIGTGKEEVLVVEENRSEGLDDTMIGAEEEVLDNFTEFETESILDILEDK